MTINPPIRRGAARRVGLRPPPTPGLLEFPRPMGAQEWADFKVRWQATEHVAIRRGRAEPNGDAAPTTVTLDNTGATWTPDEPLRPLYAGMVNYWLVRRDPPGESRRERRKRLGLHWWQRGGP